MSVKSVFLAASAAMVLAGSTFAEPMPPNRLHGERDGGSVKLIWSVAAWPVGATGFKVARREIKAGKLGTGT